MARIVEQFRWYGAKANNTNITDLEELGLGNENFDNIFNGKCILALGIQSVPGIKFYINDQEGNNPIYVGPSGIYEINLSDNYNILSLFFDTSVIQSLINDQTNNYLIIDIIYEEGG